MYSPAPQARAPRRRSDVVGWRVLGAALPSPRTRLAGQLALLAVALVIVADGLWGMQLAPRNLATVLTWVHYRGLLLGVLLAAGNAFCGICPMILVRDAARRLRAPVRQWPRWLGGKHIAVAAFAAVLFAYERFDLWSLPAATAWLVVGYFAAAVIVDTTFAGAAFCKHVCPVGQFSFLVSTLSPLEVGSRDAAVCRLCTTADCVKGRIETAPLPIVRRGCELGLFLPAKVGNLDCTFCLDCVRACPHDNVSLAPRVPGEELADDRVRSAIGRLSRRPDLAALALVFTFGALVNAFAMIGPVYVIEKWLADGLGTTSETVVLGLIFAMGLIVAPAVLCGAASWTTRRLTGTTAGLGEIAARYAFTLVPLGVGIWTAHYSFHFLTGIGTVVPVAQASAVEAFGRAVLGEPDWSWLGMRPGAVFPIQLGAVLLGGIGSVLVALGAAEHDSANRPARAAASWLIVILFMAALALWILAQPMEMRGAAFGG